MSVRVEVILPNATLDRVVLGSPHPEECCRDRAPIMTPADGLSSARTASFGAWLRALEPLLLPGGYDEARMQIEAVRPRVTAIVRGRLDQLGRVAETKA